jgi:hemolysin activation/secretion protein
MRFFTVIALIGIAGADLHAVSDKDLPKYPLPLSSSYQETAQKKSTNPESDLFERSTPKPPPFVDGDGSDLNNMPNEAYEGVDEDYLDPQDPDLGAETDLNTLDNDFDSNEERYYEDQGDLERAKKNLAPGLKSHKISPNPIKKFPSRPSIIPLHGLVIYGSKDKVGSEDLSLFEGFKIVDLHLPGTSYRLGSILKPLYMNQPFNEETLANITEAIQTYYQKHGHIEVEVLLPRQDISTEVLSLLVLITKVGDVEVKGAIWSPQERLKEILNLKKNDLIHVDEIQGKVNYINQNPFRHAKVTYTPDIYPQEMDVNLIVNERSPFRPYAGIDNQGLNLIGQTRIFAGFNYANLFDFDEIISFQYTTATDTNKYQSYTADFWIPTTRSDALRLFGGYSTVLVDSQRGKFFQASLRYEWMTYASARLLQNFQIGADFKRTNNNLEFIENDPIFCSYINELQFELGYSAAFNTTYTQFKLDVEGFYSPGRILGDQSNTLYQELRVGSTNRYVFGKGSLEMNFFLPKLSQINLKAFGQLSSANLLPQEELGIGGLQTVRGYEERTVSGDNGFYGRAEVVLPGLSIIQPRKTRSGNWISDNLALAGFFDVGRISAKFFEPQSASSQPKAATIMGTGPGLRYTLGSYVIASYDLGFKLKKNYPGGRIMSHFMLTASY